MNRTKRFLSIALFLILSFQAYSQYYSTGSDPGKLKWREIETAHFRIIFPDDYEQQAKKIAWRFESVYRPGAESLGESPRKIAVVLHTHTVNSNGMLAWSPKRVELYPTPHQRIYAQDWLDQLAVHEYRHVVQMDNLETKMPFWLKALFGEQAAAAIAGLYLPFWFLEGDAVVAETALTETGRGRNPSFLMEYKAQVLKDRPYSYDKATLGSYRDYVPNRYQFGWYMVGGIREKYGQNIWADVLAEIASKPLSVNPFNRVMKQQTGKSKEALYTDLFDDYRRTWAADTVARSANKAEELSLDARNYTNYVYSWFLFDKSVVVYKQSRDDIGRIVTLKDGREELLFTPGSILDESFSARGQKLIWAERRADVRWEHADKSVIVTYDLKTRKKQEFQFSKQLFAPVISPAGKQAAAVAIDDQNHYSLVVFDLQDGRLINEFRTPTNDYLITPAWDEQQDYIYFIGLGTDGKYLGKLDLNNSRFSRLTEPTHVDMRNLRYSNGQLIYTSAATGVDNIFAFGLQSEQSRQLTDAAFGADYAQLDEDHLIYSNYTSTGFQLVQLDSTNFVNTPSPHRKQISNSLADKLAEQEAELADFGIPDSLVYQTKPYRKLAHFFNFHSWAPAYINVNDYEIKPGVSVLSQNKLGTATAHLGYDYDWSERSGKFRGSIEYTGLFPIIRAEVNYGKRKSNYRLIEQAGDTVLVPFSWHELGYELGLRVPLRLSSGKWSQLVQPSAEYSYKQIRHNASTPHQFYEGYYQSMSYRVYGQNILRYSELDLQPKWGQTLELVYKNSPGGGTEIDDLKALQSYLYFPGLVRNQGIRIYNGFQKKETDEPIFFSDVVRFPRGIQRISNTQLYTFSADYVSPLCYPDWSLSRLFYLKRIRASLFYDFSSLTGETYNQDGSVYSIYEKYLTSIGIELTGDGHFLRLPAPVSLGLRSMFLPDFNEFRFEMLLSVDFGAI